MNPVAILVVVLLVWVYLRRRAEDEAPGWAPSDPLVPTPLADVPGGGYRTRAPNEHNTGSINCVADPEACRRWSCAQMDKALKEEGAYATVALGVIGGPTGAAFGAAWGAGVAGLTHAFGRESCQGTPTYEFVAGAATRDELGITTDAEKDRKYAGKRSGDHIVGPTTTSHIRTTRSTERGTKATTPPPPPPPPPGTSTTPTPPPPPSSTLNDLYQSRAGYMHF